MTESRRDYAPEIRSALSDPLGVCEVLGLLSDPKGFKRQSGRGVVVRCPSHDDRTPSCSVRTVPDGTIAVKCHGCGWGSDVIGLVAAVYGLSLRGRDFIEVMIKCARMGALWHVVDDLEGRDESTERRPVAPTMRLESVATTEAPRDYPSDADAFWASLRLISEDEQVAAYLRERAIDPDRVESRDLARVLPASGALPSWARCRGGTWREASYRLIVPMYDAAGVIRSVRGWRVGGDAELPKRLPPSGHKASALVMCDPWALAWLRGQRPPERVVIAEGEPDFMVWASRLNDPTTATIGIVSGSWTQELAARFPLGCRVDVWVDGDEAGDRYFSEIDASLIRRCFIRRSKAEP